MFRRVGLFLLVGFALDLNDVAVLSEAVYVRMDGARAVEDLAPGVGLVLFLLG